MLHPVLVVPFRIIFTSMGSTRFLSCCGRVSGLHGAGQKILKFESFNEIGIPDHTAIFGADVSESLVDFSNLLDALLERFFGAEDRNITTLALFCGKIRLHHFLHVETDFGGWFRSICLSEFVEIGNRSSSKIRRDRFMRFAFLQSVLDVMSTGSSEDNDIEERICAKTICTVNTDTSGFAGSVQSRDDSLFSIFVDSENFPSILRWDTTHIVMDSGQDRNRLLGDIDT